MGLKQKVRKACKSAPAWAYGPHWPCILRFSRLEIESNRDKISLDCFPSLRTINMYPLLFMKESVITSHNNNSRRIATLILGFHPSKCHAALITSCDQGSVVLAFTLVLLVLKRFWWRVVLVILMFVAWLFVDSLCLIAYHLRISRCFCAVTFQSYASSSCIELVAQKQRSASFMFSRSDLLWFALIIGVGVISARLGLANGLDDPVA